jgi:hypothetical protein
MTVSVRRAVAADAATLAGLLSNMQAHYKGPDPPGGALAMAGLLTRAGERIPFALIAEHDGKPAGFATLNPLLYGGSFSGCCSSRTSTSFPKRAACASARR